MDAVGDPAGTERPGSGHGRRLSVLVVLLAAVTAPSAALATAAHPLVPPGPLQTGPTAELTVSPNPAHPGETVTLDARNSTAPSGSITRCEFDANGNGTFTETREDCLLETSYGQVGLYEPAVRVFTENEGTATDSAVLDVVENDGPTAAIAVDPPRPEAGRSVTLSGADSMDDDGRIDSYAWELPDDTAAGETIVTSFEAPGEYVVALTVVDDDGASGTATRTIVVEERNEVPTARLTVVTAEPTVGEPVELDASDSADPDGSIEAYAWDFDGDGNTDRTTETPGTSYEPESTGPVAIGVTVIDDGGASDSATVRFDVGEATTDGTPSQTAAPATATPAAAGSGPLDGLDLGLVPFVPDVIGALLLLVLIAAGAAVSVGRRGAVAERVDTLRELLVRGDVRRKIAKKVSGATVKTTAKKAIRRFSDLIEAGGEGVGEAFERAGRAIKRTSKRVAEWLRQFGA